MTPGPKACQTCRCTPNLFAELIRRGWSDADLQLLAGGNVMRVLEENERTAKRLATLPAPGLSETKP